MNRSKAIGTRAETAVVNLARSLGFEDAERLALAGAEDRGDIRLMRDPLIILEVKAGKKAQDASWEQIKRWLEQTANERNNAWKALVDKTIPFHGFLVTQRRGYGSQRVADWCIWTIEDDPICSCTVGASLPSGMYPLGDFLKTMRDHWRVEDGL